MSTHLITVNSKYSVCVCVLLPLFVCLFCFFVFFVTVIPQAANLLNWKLEYIQSTPCVCVSVVCFVSFFLFFSAFAYLCAFCLCFMFFFCYWHPKNSPQAARGMQLFMAHS